MKIEHFKNKLVKNYLSELNLNNAVHYILYILLFLSGDVITTKIIN
jgi:hypothetical protein